MIQTISFTGVRYVKKDNLPSCYEGTSNNTGWCKPTTECHCCKKCGFKQLMTII